MENVRICLVRGQHGLRRVGLVREELRAERLIRLFCGVFARDHARDHILRDGKEFVRGDADVHMVLLDHRTHVLEIIGQTKADVLAVAQKILSVVDDAVLRVLGEHDMEHLHRLCAAGVVLLKIAAERDLEIRGGHQPLLAVLTEERQEGGIDALVLEDLNAHRRAEVHGKLAAAHPVHDAVVGQRQVSGVQSGVADEVLEVLEGRRPDCVVQTDLFGARRVAVRGAPLAARRRGKLGDRKSLKRLHAGVVVGIVRVKAADAVLFERAAGGNEARVIGRQRNAVFLEQAAVDHEAVRVRADREPADAAVLVLEAVEIGVVDRARLVGRGEVHQAVLQRRGVVQREAAAGDDVRQTAVLVQKPVKIQIVVADDELNVHIRKLRLDIGGVIFVQRGVPQIDLNGLRVLLRFVSFRAAAGQQADACDQYREQEGQTAPHLLLFHKPISLPRDGRRSPEGRISFVFSFFPAVVKRQYINSIALFGHKYKGFRLFSSETGKNPRTTPRASCFSRRCTCKPD